jgi:hexosaminidase
MIVEQLKPHARGNILGVEAQVWSETIKGRDMVEYYMLPKLIGFAESAWAAPRSWETTENRVQRESGIQADWNVYANTLAKKELPRLAYLNGGYNYRIPPPGGVIADGVLSANSEYPGLVIRYTTDGSIPAETSLIYTKPVAVDGLVRVRSFDASGRGSRVIDVSSE